MLFGVAERAAFLNRVGASSVYIVCGSMLMAKRRNTKTIEDVPWPPLDWEPPPLREDELTVLEGEVAKLDQRNVKPKPR